MKDYAHVLYDGEWKNTNPRGPTPGILTNFTQDLLFSMERLSQNPYPLRLVKPNDALPFELPDNMTSTIAGTSLKKLQQGGQLFVVDRKLLSANFYRN